MKTPPMDPPLPPSSKKPGTPSGPPRLPQAEMGARAEATFTSALEHPTERRNAFVAEACAGDDTLDAEVRALLAAHHEAGDFMDESPVSPEVEAELARLKPEEQGERIGRYKLLQEIGEGGFGTVWMAEQLEPVSRRVALKIIKMGMDTREVIARFEAERQALAMMDHPNIAKVLDAGATERGRPFFVMELVKGIPITEFCDQKQLDTRERLALFGDVCSAINHAHQKGVIHRDIKPSNVMVTLHGDKAVVKVIDFGIAKATQGKLTDKTLFTRFEQFVGTPVYMSPEQAALSGLDIDTRSDIYALGILLYELLTGNPPFDAKSLASAGYDEMRRIIREVEPLRPSLRLGTVEGDERTTLAKARHVEPEKLRRLVEPDLDWIVMKAIEKDRSRRYETANGLALDIQRFLADEPVSASPPSASYQFRKFARRNKAALRVAAAIAAVLVAATLLSTWQAVRATRAEDLAKVRLAEVATERDQKDQALQDAEVVSRFLGDVFSSSDPSRNGRVITVAESLDKAAERLEATLAGQPARRARLQAILVRTYHGLGLYSEAIRLQEKVRDYWMATSGPGDPETIDAIGALALLYNAGGRSVEAVKLQEPLLASCRMAYGPEHPATFRCMNNLAVSYFALGRYDQALKLREEVLPLCRKINGPEHPEMLTAMANLATSYAEAGRHDEGRKLFEEVLTLSRKVNGPDHPATLNAMAGLGTSYMIAGRLDEAIKLQEEILPLHRKVNGPEHPATLNAMEGLARSYLDAGRTKEAITLLEEVLPLSRKVLGPDHPETISASHNAASSYFDAGRRDEALKLREEVLAQSRKIRGPDNPDTLMGMNNLAVSYFVAGRHDEALKLREEVLTLYQKVNGPDHPDTLTAMGNLALSYGAEGRREKAIELQEKVLERRRKLLGAEHPDSLAAMDSLLDSLQAAGSTDRFLKLLAESYALRPKDSMLSQKLTALQAWFGKDEDFVAANRLVLEGATGTDDPSKADRAAKGYCLRPSTDPQLLEKALALARRAVDLGKGNKFLPYFDLALGMAEYRKGDWLAADKALQTAMELANNERDIIDVARLYRAMSLFRQNRRKDAEIQFAKAESQMRPLPADDSRPLADKARPDHIIIWLAYKEARALLAKPGAPARK